MASVDELWLVDFGTPYRGEPGDLRPALIIGPPEAFGPGVPFVVVVPLATTRRGLPLHVEVEASAATGLDVVGYAQCELLRSVNRSLLVQRLGTVDPERSRRMAAVVRTPLGY